MWSSRVVDMTYVGAKLMSSSLRIGGTTLSKRSFVSLCGANQRMIVSNPAERICSSCHNSFYSSLPTPSNRNNKEGSFIIPLQKKLDRALDKYMDYLQRVFVSSIFGVKKHYLKNTEGFVYNLDKEHVYIDYGEGKLVKYKLGVNRQQFNIGTRVRIVKSAITVTLLRKADTTLLEPVKASVPSKIGPLIDMGYETEEQAKRRYRRRIGFMLANVFLFFTLMFWAPILFMVAGLIIILAVLTA